MIATILFALALGAFTRTETAIRADGTSSAVTRSQLARSELEDEATIFPAWTSLNPAWQYWQSADSPTEAQPGGAGLHSNGWSTFPSTPLVGIGLNTKYSAPDGMEKRGDIDRHVEFFAVSFLCKDASAKPAHQLTSEEETLLSARGQLKKILWRGNMGSGNDSSRAAMNGKRTIHLMEGQGQRIVYETAKEGARRGTVSLGSKTTEFIPAKTLKCKEVTFSVVMYVCSEFALGSECRALASTSYLLGSGDFHGYHTLGGLTTYGFKFTQSCEKFGAGNGAALAPHLCTKGKDGLLLLSATDSQQVSAKAGQTHKTKDLRTKRERARDGDEDAPRDQELTIGADVVIDDLTIKRMVMYLAKD